MGVGAGEGWLDPSRHSGSQHSGLHHVLSYFQDLFELTLTTTLGGRCHCVPLSSER